MQTKRTGNSGLPKPIARLFPSRRKSSSVIGYFLSLSARAKRLGLAKARPSNSELLRKQIRIAGYKNSERMMFLEFFYNLRKNGATPRKVFKAFDTMKESERQMVLAAMARLGYRFSLVTDKTGRKALAVNHEGKKRFLGVLEQIFSEIDHFSGS